MDKAGSILKAIMPAPTANTIKDVEYGCEHLQAMMTKTAEREKFLTSFTNLQTLLARPLDAQTTKDSKDSKIPSVTTLRPTFLCLQCATITSQEDRDSHAEATRHKLCIESRSGCLYCCMCEDFVYDPTLEKIRVEQSVPAAAGRKRKLSSLYPQGEEDKFVVPNSNALSCMAGSPRGIYNLGYTCYMTVILQSLIHNPLMRNFFLSNGHDTTDCPLADCLACGLTAMFADVFATEKIDGFGPTDLLHKSWNLFSDLAGAQQQDCHEWFQFVLNALHSACRCTSGSSCDCLYHQTFFGKFSSTVTCLACGNVTRKKDIFIDLCLDLPHYAKRRKLNAKKASGETSSEVLDTPLEVSGCLKNFTSPEDLEVYTCDTNKCGSTNQKSKKHLTIKKLPPAMCLQLKRYEHRQNNAKKLNIRCNFSLQLDMTPYTTRAQIKNKTAPAKEVPGPRPPSPTFPRSQGWYDLSTVVVHNGDMKGGHYYCYCRRDDQWFKFDDFNVFVATEAEVLKADAYMLFYMVRNMGSVAEKVEKKTNVEIKEKANDETEEKASGAD